MISKILSIVFFLKFELMLFSSDSDNCYLHSILVAFKNHNKNI